MVLIDGRAAEDAPGMGDADKPSALSQLPFGLPEDVAQWVLAQVEAAPPMSARVRQEVSEVMAKQTERRLRDASTRPAA